jgi:two-component system cell cycle response regulator
MRTAHEINNASAELLASVPTATRLQSVLVIDTDVSGRDTFANDLSSRGFQVSACSSLAAALAQNGTPPELIVVDLDAHACAPAQTLAPLSDRADWSEIPVICLSTNRENTLAALELGVGDVLAKTVDLNELAARIRGQLRRAGRLAALLTQSHVDPLTGLLNRRGLMVHFEKTLARARRAGEMVSVLLIDLDGFKPVNDRLGHAVGDELLRRVGEALKSGSRCEDTVARLGGDEFVVVLPRADRIAARRVAARIRRTMSEIVIPGAIRGVHGSIGVVTGDAGELSLDQLLAEADEKMYADKRERRNGARRAAGSNVLPLNNDNQEMSL